MQTKRKFNADFKSKVVLECLKERSTIEELSHKYELHPSQIHLWKKQFLANCGQVFGDGKQDNKDQDKLIKELYAQIGELKVSNDCDKRVQRTNLLGLCRAKQSSNAI